MTAAPIIVPGDPSSAAFPLVAGLIVPRSEVTVEGGGIKPPAAGLLECLSERGAALRARPGTLTGAQIPAERAPRMIAQSPILAIAAACARGRTMMRGLA